ncbi:MAG: ribonuclease catalytic domain-containing protein [Thermodesulfobacteriota bacterium]
MIKKIPKLNEVVVFRKRSEPSFGVLRESLGERVSLFSEEGKEVEVDFSKVVLSTGIKLGSELTQSEKKLKLRGIRKRLDEKKSTVDLKTLWECVSDSGKELTLDDLVELYFSEDGTEKEDILLLFWAVEKDDLYFKRGENGYKPKTSKEVEETRLRKEAERKRLIEHKAAINWARGIIEGREDELESDFKNYLELIKGYVIHLDKFERAPEAKLFMSEVGIRDVEGAIEFLIKAGGWREDEDPLFKRLGLKEGFPKRVLEEAKRIIEEPFVEDGFEDLTSLETYAIDDETTEDIDDAISIWESPEGFMIGIHIANVASLISKWSLLDEEATRRGETIYLPEGHVHMFPPELIREKLSLFEGAPKYALSLLVLFNERLSIKSYRFTKSKILVKKNLSYDKADETFLKSSIGQKLIQVAQGLRKKRMEAGAFVFQFPALKIRVVEGGEIDVKKISMNTDAHLVVSEFMILMNWLSGRFFKEKGIPGIFRSQLEPVSEDARLLDENDPLFSLRAIKYLKPSRIGLSSEPHFSLGVDAYVQITSPIRRYLDLVLQRQIIGELDSQGAPYKEEELERLYPQVEVGIREKKMVERARERYWLLKHLKGLEGKEVTGIVSSLRETSMSIYLTDYLLELPVPYYSEMDLKEGDTVNLIVERVDPLRRKVVLIPIES